MDARSTTRHALRVRCQAVRERDFRLLGDLAVDVSADGMLVPTSMAVLTGDAVLVSFQVPGTSTWIDAEATVARVLHGRRPGEAGRFVGLAFQGVDARARRELRDVLARRVPERIGVGRVRAVADDTGAWGPLGGMYGCDVG